MGRLDEAVREYRHALAFAPESVRGLNALAAVLAAQAENEAAADQFRRSLELDPRNQETRGDYVALLNRLGRINEASRVAAGHPE